MEKRAFKVIIVGCSISGMALAHSLDRAGIDFVILEKHRDIFAAPGISIGLMPNGSRILEQLGLYSDIDQIRGPLNKIYQFLPDGFCIEGDSPVNIVKRFGLPICVIERQKVLNVLFSKFHDKTRIHLNEEVVEISHKDSGISVQTASGTTFSGDLVVGADGVHSAVRSEMWRIGNLNPPGFITEKEKSELTAEYGCVFGVSTAVPGEGRWEHIVRYNKDVTLMFFPANGTDNFFNVIYKLKKKHAFPNIPRLTQEEAIEVCESVAELPVWGNIKFGDIWKQKTTFTLVPLEEHMYRKWHHRRIVCIGDSVSKMCPNMGQGGNTAIEAAAGLTNALRRQINANYPYLPSENELNNMLKEFNTKQYNRLQGIHKDSQYVTRLQSLDDNSKRFVAYYVMANCGDLLLGNISRAVARGEVLDFIPLTVRSGRDWPPCPPQFAWGIQESIDFCKKLSMAVTFVLIAILLGKRLN